MRLRYSPRARGDIAGIHAYIAQRNGSAATAVVRQIRSTSELLARYPGLGRETDISGVRVFPVARYPYLVYCRVREDELVVIHVRDGRRHAPREGEL
jgi:plasmid stabilization system protein ParE